jgi:hypothetical protein
MKSRTADGENCPLTEQMSPLKYKQCHELPPRTDLACEFSVSESTVSSAKRLPAAAKILTSLTRHPGLIAIRGAMAPENAIKPGGGWGWGLRG